jgi:hypothetical protein
MQYNKDQLKLYENFKRSVLFHLNRVQMQFSIFLLFCDSIDSLETSLKQTLFLSMYSMLKVLQKIRALQTISTFFKTRYLREKFNPELTPAFNQQIFFSRNCFRNSY